MNLGLENARNRRLWALALLFTYCLVGLYPFQFDLPDVNRNSVTRGPGHILVFNAPGIARTKSAPEWLTDAIELSSLRVSANACPLSSNQRGPARIVAISRNTRRQNLIIAQAQNDLIVRVRRPSSDMSGYPPYIIPGAFKETVCRQIAVQIERDTLTINVAGFDGLVAPLGENSLNAWDTEMRLAVGNEQTGDRPWLGEIRTLIAGTSSRRIDYLASTDLEIPKLWWRIPGRIQRLEEAGPWITNPLDATLNFLGFFPIPVIILVLAGARLRTTTLLSIAFSITVSIEVGQLFVVGRQPSLSDVGMNFGGAATALGLMYLTNIYSQIQPPE